MGTWQWLGSALSLGRSYDFSERDPCLWAQGSLTQCQVAVLLLTASSVSYSTFFQVRVGLSFLGPWVVLPGLDTDGKGASGPSTNV